MKAAGAPAFVPDAEDNTIRLNGAGHVDNRSLPQASPEPGVNRRKVSAALRSVEAMLRVGDGGDPEIANDEPTRSEPRSDDAINLLRLYHRAAEGQNGVLMLGTVNPTEDKPEEKKKAPYRTQRFKIGNAADMAKEAVNRAEFANVYFAPAVIKPDLKKGARGKKEDIIAVLGFAADDDRDNGKPAVMPPIEPSAIVQTCETPTVNRHPHWVLSRPLTLEEAEPIASLMKRKVGGDSGTGDIAHVWRAPGTLNHPNKAKLDRGRPKEPQPVRLVGGTMRPVDPDVLRRALESMPDLAPTKAKDETKTKDNSAKGHSGEEAAPTGDAVALIKKLKAKLREAIATEGAGDRSKHSFSVMCQLFDAGLTGAEVLIIATGAPFARKYQDRLDEEIERVRQKWKERQEIAAAGAAGELEQLNSEFAVVRINGKTRVMGFEDNPATPGVLVPVYQSFADFKAFESKYRVEVMNDETGAVEIVKRGEWWLEHPRRRQYKGVVFAPNATESDLLGRFNLWTGFTCEPMEGDCSLYLAHLTGIICSGNDEHATYLLDWMAWGVQNPGERAGVAVVTRGGEGAGKGIAFKTYGRLFGAHFVHATRPQHVVGGFNSHLQQCSVLFADEAFFAGDRSNDGILKGLITEETLRVEPKGIDSFEVKNALKVCMASNNDWVIPAGSDARRYFVLDVSDAEKQNLPYFKAIATQMETGGREALLYFLLNRDLSDFDIRAVPKTKALAEQKAYSRRGLDLLVETLISDGELPAASDGRANIAITSGERNGEGFYPSARKLVPDLKHMSSIVMKRRLCSEWGCKHWHVGSANGIEFPPLEEMRKRFDCKHGPQEWNTEAGEWQQ